MSAGAGIKASTLLGSRADAHSRVVICVSLSTAAIALPPSTPMLFRLTLRVQAKCNVSRGHEQKSERMGWGALQIGQSGRWQGRCDSLPAFRSKIVFRDAAECTESASVQRALNTSVRATSGPEPHLSVVRDELGRAAAMAEMPLVSDTNSSSSS